MTYCDACGAKIEEGQNFCRACGREIAVAAGPVAARPRVATHLRVLAVLWIVRGVLHLIPGLFLRSFSHWAFFDQVSADVPPFIHSLLDGIGWVFLLGAAACFIAAWGLLDKAPWARVFTIVVGAISLIEFPIGTALGIYTLWVLLPESSDAEYSRLAMS
ncbi:MAG TPA: zinc ribbon domain-containing protein [Bryobacteraceae bacterium]|nr:zinc ribbon domain-containing protein [Bryobacteraceae bacterium]